MEEKQLVKSVLRGNPGAFELLLNQHLGLVIHMIAPMVPNTEDREEIIQDVFLKVHKNLERFKFDSKLSTWIGQIAYRTGLNYLKRKKMPRATDDLRELDAILGHEDLSTEKKDNARFVRQMVNKLPHPYQTILSLYYLEEMSYKEIMDVTGLPDGTVKNYLFRAKKKLEAMMAPFLERETGIL